MPNIVIPVPEVEEAVTRPTLMAIARQIMEITQIPKDTRINFRGKAKGVAQRGTAMQDGDVRNNVMVSGQDIVEIDVDRVPNENRLGSQAGNQPEHMPVFVDEYLGVVLRPAYIQSEFTITFTYNTRSKTLASRWLDDMQLHVSAMREINLHKANYHYSIPPDIIERLKEIHKLREAVAGYGDTFGQWMTGNATTRMTEIANMDGSATLPAFTELQGRIQGVFDFTVIPKEIQPNSENTSWVAQFSYRLNFDEPRAMAMVHPIMIHNQIVDSKFLTEPAPSDDEHRKSFSRSFNALNRFEVDQDRAMHYNARPVIAVPKFDEFVPDKALPDMRPIVTVLCAVDESENRWLTTLDDLGDEVEFDSDVMKYIQGEIPYLTKPYQSAIHVACYRWRYLSSHTDFYVDENLRVMSKNDLSLRVNHRVMVCVMKKLNVLNVPALKRLAMNPKAASKILATMRVSGEDLLSVRHLVDFFRICPEYKPFDPSWQVHKAQLYQLNTVQTGYILTAKQTQQSELKPPMPTHNL